MKREGKMFDSVSYDKHRRQVEVRVMLQKRFLRGITVATVLFISHVIWVELTK